MTSYTPAQVTEKTGFTIDTLRYYERIGLLHEVGRTAGGRRFFTEQDVEFLQLLRCLRYTGMPVAEMLRFVSLLRSDEATREERVDVLRDHEARVASQIARLQEHQDHIRFKIRLYSGASEMVPAG
ncbi:MerR family transcriptional regulator [Amycolatopsis mediterranei S699]|uniref:MerR family transcriptional regulator n=2 Tax=Amycolatopsis mediterranei TaxID=33910 RepID=A0A0H3D0F1_AMYMU|nr:MerR family transcriptional regulator [Amycolatopsis mediterranei]ADJ44093.1 MerR family transcriptional regulator [Amycolatopsis mediterranei U32]AEK40828.1 MerR family transcriptional regulator [Amycolatopsis mediterranei S699]AFO75806.1 MerR family transcriptional regulator [Amycolatopsis mediterranei S699]AGT82935.1 MerR family transcriptional regulator [Amycolatopsis mediterranei RB]KDO06476.1 MerR family transcriptional regulator [Amycolatopsis mediterranei]